MGKVALVLANGFEEIEAITLIDVLRRAEVDLTLLGVEGERITGAHGVQVGADAPLAGASQQSWEMLVLPGGIPGATTLRDHEGVQALIKAQHAAGRPIAAICAAPIALGKAGLLQGRNATCYPGFEDQLTGATPSEDRIVRDGIIRTSRGPGTAMEFALSLVAELKGDATAQTLRQQMLVAT